MHDLCSLPNVDIEVDDGKDFERRRAYLRSIIEEGRTASPGWMTIQFGFDMVSSNHAHGVLYVVDSGPHGTRIWEMRGQSEDVRRPARRDTRGGIPRPLPGQAVMETGRGLGDLTEDDLIVAIATLVAERVMNG